MNTDCKLRLYRIPCVDNDNKNHKFYLYVLIKSLQPFTFGTKMPYEVLEKSV